VICVKRGTEATCPPGTIPRRRARARSISYCSGKCRRGATARAVERASGRSSLTPVRYWTQTTDGEDLRIVTKHAAIVFGPSWRLHTSAGRIVPVTNLAVLLVLPLS